MGTGGKRTLVWWSFKVSFVIVFIIVFFVVRELLSR